MTHSPPVPIGNQSPYPLHEPAHLVAPAPFRQVKADPFAGRSLVPALAAVGAVLGGGLLVVAARHIFRRTQAAGCT